MKIGVIKLVIDALVIKAGGGDILSISTFYMRQSKSWLAERYWW